MEKKKIKTKKKGMKFKPLFILLSLILLVTGGLLIYKLCVVDVLSSKYFYPAVGGIVLLTALLIFIYMKKFKMWIKVPFILIGLVLIAGEIYGAYNLNATSKFVENIVNNAVNKEEIYNIYVLNDAKYESKNDLNGAKMGMYDNGSETLSTAIKQLKKTLTFKEEDSYDDLETMLTDGVNKKIDAFLVTSSLAELLADEYPDLMSKFRILDTVTVSFKAEEVKKSNVDVTKEPFIIYISGIDTYGSINTVSRSDVNILAVINPKTNKVLLVNTPRDYYVMLHSKKAMDKLTHAGIYGVEESLTTLEDLYANDIDFYFKVNFSSLIKIVDSIGGITVNSKYAFSYDGYSFKKGTNYLNGKAALAFSRCRKELPNGDISRGENQEAVIEAILNKVTSTAIISKYATILNTLSKSFVTNMSEDDIYKLAKYQLDSNPKWTVESANVTGTSASRTTYSAGRTKLYVMLQDENSISEVKTKIKETLEEE